MMLIGFLLGLAFGAFSVAGFFFWLVKGME